MTPLRGWVVWDLAFYTDDTPTRVTSMVLMVSTQMTPLRGWVVWDLAFYTDDTPTGLG